MNKRSVRLSLVAKALVLVAITAIVVADVTAEPSVAHPGYDDFMQYNMWGVRGTRALSIPAGAWSTTSSS